MTYRILSHWHLNKELFVKVLANDKTSLNNKIWAYYRLGMYSNVIKLQSYKMNWKVIFAKIISYAATGNNTLAREWFEQINRCWDCNRHLDILASGLAPFMPQEALSLTKNQVLSIALLAKLDLRAQAVSQSKDLLHKKVYKEEPDLLLYYSNVNKEYPSKEKLLLLNKYLLQYKLIKVKLVDEAKPLSIHNITTKQAKSYLNSALVTVIVTTYNSEITISTALKSILMQTYINLEVIVVDDNSDDNTVDIVKTFMHQDNRVRLVELSKNRGTYIAKNIALEEATGEFVTCHDSDDFSHPLKIQHQVVPLLENKKLIASISDWIRIDDYGIYYARHIYPLKRMNHSSLLYKRVEVYNKIGVYDSVRTGADSEFYARLGLKFGKKAIKRVKEPLSLASHRENSLMTDKKTGYSELGISSDRLVYWEAWNQWHIDMIQQNKFPYISPKAGIKREFQAPLSIVVKND